MKICILIYANHHVREAERFIESFVKEGYSLENFIVYNAGGYDLRQLEFYLSLKKASRVLPLPLMLLEKLANILIKKNCSIRFVTSGILNYVTFSAFLKKNKVSAVAVFEASIGYGSEFYFKACKKNLIPLYIMPYSFASWLEPCVSYYNSKCRSFSKAPLWCKQKWFSQFRGRLISRLPPTTAFFLDILGFSNFIPTADSSATIGTYVLESQAFADHLVKEGIDPARISICGSYSLYLLNVAKNKIKVLKNSDKIKIVFQLSPDVTQYDFYFDTSGYSYNDFLEKIFKVFETYSEHVEFVIISHPLTTIPINILNTFSVKVSKDTIFDEIAGCAAYIASISSTIRWALALHLPVINFDFYKFGYTEFVCAKNLCYVDNFDDFARELGNLINYLIGDKKTSNIFDKSQNYWGVVDTSFPNNFLREIK